MMGNKKVWFITGAGRGMGVEFAKAALVAGYQVVATGRNPNKVAKALWRDGESSDCETGCNETFGCRGCREVGRWPVWRHRRIS
jgi:NAD(P)-dependent dehydrogenase (short-subunit alcohol dehydrogenase family)